MRAFSAGISAGKTIVSVVGKSAGEGFGYTIGAVLGLTAVGGFGSGNQKTGPSSDTVQSASTSFSLSTTPTPNRS